MLKLLFEWLVDPLGLPINPLYEYLIMLVVGELAYQFAYDKTGTLSHKEYMSSGQKSIIHWTIRLLFYCLVWAVLRAGIWVYGFVMENKGVAIISVICIAALVVTIQVFKGIEEKKRLELDKVRIEERREDVSDESDC